MTNPSKSPEVALADLAELARDSRDADTDCPLTRGEQTHNLLLFATCTGAIYLAAPVGYVGVTQASLCNELGASSTVANLPATAYFTCTVMPVLLAWLVPQVAKLKATLAICFALNTASLVAVAVALLSPAPNGVKIGMVIAQAAVSGAVMPSAVALLWEAIGRGVSERRRGLALSLAFGGGPVLATIGSLGSQLLLSGSLGPLKLPGIGFPWNFAMLFLAAVPVTALGAVLAGRFIAPLPLKELDRQPFLRGVFGGIWNFVNNRVLLTAAVVTILLYTENTIPSNLNLYTKQVLGADPDQYAGAQNAWRFGCKAVAGLFLGWLLTKTNPKLGILVTAAIFLSALVWAMFASGLWYLAAFGLYGAGELVGVYAPNYILSASAPTEIRRNMALVTLLMAPAAPAGAVFGWIADYVGRVYGPAAGFKASFAVCAAVVAAGILLAIFRLPARPRSAPGGNADHISNAL